MSDDATRPDLPSIRDFKSADRPHSPVTKGRIASWALWDWATQPFNTVITTFVFTALYLTSDDFMDPAIAALGEGDALYEAELARLTGGLANGLLAGGILVALLAPVLGQRADASGRRKAWLGAMTLLLTACMVGLFFVEASPGYFLLGVALITAGSVFGEIAGVNYNAMLTQVSTPSTVGRISGLGWGLGYLGGIVALVLVVVATEFDFWGMNLDNGMAFRVIALGSALWTLLFAWPLFAFVPEAPRAERRETVSLWRGYAVLAHDLAELWRHARSTLWFLLASAVYRDGLAGVFAFGAIIAAAAFGFSDTEVMIFGIAANLIAGVSTLLAGRFDDKVGPRAVIVSALGTIVVAGLVVVVAGTAFDARGDTANLIFWVCGLALSASVGPAQAASRSLLARVSPVGREAEIFGLYATTGRAASFMAPGAWGIMVAITGATIWGTLGIVSVVLVGLVLLLFVRTPADKGSAA